MPRSPLQSTGLVAITLLLAAVALPASAQWAWRDASGRTVYSDQPPPAGVKSEQILRQPGPYSQGAPAPAPDAKSAPKTYAEREMEFRKRQQERAETDRKQAEEQARSEQKSQECERMRGYLRALDEGQRIARTDSQGNREFLDDAQRAAEIQRVRDALNRSCN
jgi:type IV secretory pathway VirB10-like protein